MQQLKPIQQKQNPQQKKSKDSPYSLDSLKQIQFKNISQIRVFLSEQATKNGLDKSNSLFIMTTQQGDLTVFRCKFQHCPAFMKFRYQDNGEGSQGFRLFDMVDAHLHNQKSSINTKKRQLIQQIKSHPILSGKLNGYNSTKPHDKIDKNKAYTIQFASSCIKNPGQASIAYIVKQINSNRQILINKNKIGERTNNQAQFIAFIWGGLDCLQNGIQKLNAFTNNSVVLNSMKEEGKVKAINLQDAWGGCKMIQSLFQEIQFTYKKRDNKKDKVPLLCKQCFKQK